MIRYYKIIREDGKIEIWHGDSDRINTIKHFGFILPLDRKPKNVSRETIKEF